MPVSAEIRLAVTVRFLHVIAIASLIGCNTNIVAGIFDMLNFMIMSLQQLAKT